LRGPPTMHLFDRQGLVRGLAVPAGGGSPPNGAPSLPATPPRQQSQSVVRAAAAQGQVKGQGQGNAQERPLAATPAAALISGGGGGGGGGVKRGLSERVKLGRSNSGSTTGGVLSSMGSPANPRNPAASPATAQRL